MRFNRLIAIVTFMVAAGPSIADDYVVQFGALKQPYEAYSEKARRIGRVYTVTTTSGFTLYKMGPFESDASAMEAMEKLRSLGYRDAYIKDDGSKSEAITPRMVNSTSKTSKDIDPLMAVAALPDAVRSKLVYVDGVLHVKEGDQFIPLGEYRY